MFKYLMVKLRLCVRWIFEKQIRITIYVANDSFALSSKLSKNMYLKIKNLKRYMLVHCIILYIIINKKNDINQFEIMIFS